MELLHLPLPTCRKRHRSGVRSSISVTTSSQITAPIQLLGATRLQSGGNCFAGIVLLTIGVSASENAVLLNTCFLQSGSVME